MSKLNIACLLSPMADTEGPMSIENGNTLSGAKTIMGKYGEVGLEAAITFGEKHPDKIHTDILSIGRSKDVTSIQQNAIAMFQPGKHPGTLGVHALNLENIDEFDGFAVAKMLSKMIAGLPQKPDLIFAGRESWDYAHGVVGPALAEQLGYPYFSGVNEISINEDMKSVTAIFIEGNDKNIFEIKLPAIFGTTDWLNGKDSARFTSLKGVMMAKKFKRTEIELSSIGISAEASQTHIKSISPVKNERKNRTLTSGTPEEMAKQAMDILVNQDKTLNFSTSSSAETPSSTDIINWRKTSPQNLSLDNSVLVIADHDGIRVSKSTHKTLSLAREVASSKNMQLTLIILSRENGELAESVYGFGADQILWIKNPAFQYSNVKSIAAALKELVSNPSFVFTVANDLGRDLAAYLASAYGGGLLQDIIHLDYSETMAGTRIVSNARFQTIESATKTTMPTIISVRAAAFESIKDNRSSSYDYLEIENVENNAKLLETVQGAEVKGIPLNEAKIIFSGGRGMKSAENFALLNQLADKLNGAVGASRAVTDLEWVPHNLQIGQTGTTVAPDLYFAVGISGAIQHLTGMLGSKYIVAINHDADAPIHKHADLSIIEKWENFLPSFLEEISKSV